MNKKKVLEYQGKFYESYWDLINALPIDQRPVFDEEELWQWEKWYVQNHLKIDVQEHTLEK